MKMKNLLVDDSQDISIRNSLRFLKDIAKLVCCSHNWSFSSFLASSDFCRLLITFANSLDPDLALQNCIYFSEDHFFLLTNSVDPDEMFHNVTFHLGLPCLP